MKTKSSKMNGSSAEDGSSGVNSIPRTGSIVELMLNIIDHDGPQPMKNMRPTQKHPNGADHFHEDHQGQFEARCKRSDDRVARVNMHNSAHPKLNDELDKRRSTAKPTALLQRNLKTRLKTRSGKDRRNARTNKSKNQRNTRARAGISKRPKPRRFRSPNARLSITTTRGCQCQYLSNTDSKCVATCVSKYNMDASVGEEVRNERPVGDNAPASDTNILFKNNSKSEIESRNPDTSEPSLSSYDSYMSMDHEPMVSP